MPKDVGELPPIGNQELRREQSLVPTEKVLPQDEIRRHAFELAQLYKQALKRIPAFNEAVVRAYFGNSHTFLDPILFSKDGFDYSVILRPSGNHEVLQVYRHDPQVPLVYENGKPNTRPRSREYEERIEIAFPDEAHREEEAAIIYRNLHTNQSAENSNLAVVKADELLENLRKSDDTQPQGPSENQPVLPSPQS